MKKLFFVFVLLWLHLGAFSQKHKSLQYTALVYNSSNALVKNTTISMRLSILQWTDTGKAVFVETLNKTTDANGKVVADLGSGTPVTGTFSGIDWLEGPYHIKVEIDPANGTNYGVVYHQKLTFTGFFRNIGDSCKGGILAYILQPGDPGYDAKVPHGLIVSKTDLAFTYWDDRFYTKTGASGTALGTGLANTNKIIATLSSEFNAALLARSYNGGGYTDWYLPSKDELNKLFLNRTKIGGFNNAYYWSSSEGSDYYAWVQSFNNDGHQEDTSKDINFFIVRPVRAF